MKTAKDLVKYVIGLIGNAYGYGVQGVVLTEALLLRKIAQYPDRYTPSYIGRTRKHSLGRLCFDCTTAADLFTGMDYSANGWLAAAQRAGGKTDTQNAGITWGYINTIPEIPGLAVHYEGHMGTYIGNGEVVEARGVDYGVVKTKLKDRPWKCWAKIPGIEYGIVYPVPKRTLRRFFTRGEDVKWLQQELKNLGFYTAAIDGSYGPKTQQAVRDYQISRRLKLDGVCGPQTRTALLRE